MKKNLDPRLRGDDGFSILPSAKLKLISKKGNFLIINVFYLLQNVKYILHYILYTLSFPPKKNYPEEEL